MEVNGYVSIKSENKGLQMRWIRSSTGPWEYPGYENICLQICVLPSLVLTVENET